MTSSEMTKRSTELRWLFKKLEHPHWMTDMTDESWNATDSKIRSSDTYYYYYLRELRIKYGSKVDDLLLEYQTRRMLDLDPDKEPSNATLPRESEERPSTIKFLDRPPSVRRQ